jgi:hypothetical protein
MRDSLDLCPVPTEQQPTHEYEQLQESWLFNWATFEQGKYIRKLIWVWVWGWFLAGPITAASFSPKTDPFKFALWGNVGASILVLLMLSRLYLGWSYVRNRLCQDQVIYEESGWYDGQVWDKPQAVLQRDRLIVSYQVEPILQRLRRTFLLLISLMVLAGCGGSLL